jgi:hypothetical protein
MSLPSGSVENWDILKENKYGADLNALGYHRGPLIEIKGIYRLK